MELRQLELFVAVAEELHFGRAAARVHLSQPAFTQAIAAFENQLGARLLERTTRKVELTGAGEALLPRARALLADAASAETLVSRTARGELGTVRIGVVGTAMLDLLPALARAVRLARPDLELELTEEPGADQVADLRAGHLDLGIVHAQPDDAPGGISLLELRSEALSVALPNDHRLAHRRVLRLGELAGDPLVMMAPAKEADTSAIYIGACVQAGFTPDVAAYVTSLQALLGYVAANIGWAFVASRAADTLTRHGVVYVPLKGTTAKLSTSMAWVHGRLTPSSRLVLDTATAL